MTILAPDGYSLLEKTVLPMTNAQIAWFSNADQFLRNVPHLWTLHLKVFCLRCWRAKVNDEIHVTWNDTTQDYHVRCACATVTGRLPRHEVAQMETDEFLARVGWSLACTGRCASESGFADGVEANNDQLARTVSIRCGCTTRLFQFPEAARVVA